MPGDWVPVFLTSGMASATKTVVASSISKVSSSGGALYYCEGFTTASVGAIMRLYNSTTSGVVMGTGITGYVLVTAQSSATPHPRGGANIWPHGILFSNGCSFDVVLSVTSTAAVAGNTYCTFQFV